MCYLLFLWILLGLGMNVKLFNYLRLKNDPGTYSVCYTQYSFTVWLNLPEFCPYFCEEGVRHLKFNVTAKFNLESSRCDCFNTTALCQQSSKGKKLSNLVFYVDSK